MFINNNFKKLALGAAITSASMMSWAADPTVTVSFGSHDNSVIKDFGKKIIDNVLFTPCHKESSALTTAQTAVNTATTAFDNKQTATETAQTEYDTAKKTDDDALTALKADPLNGGLQVAKDNAADVLSGKEIALIQAEKEEADAKALLDTKKEDLTTVEAGPVINGTAVNKYNDTVKIDVAVKGNKETAAGGEFEYDLYVMVINLSAPGHDVDSGDGGVAADIDDDDVDLTEGQVFVFSREEGGASGDLTLTKPLKVKQVFDAKHLDDNMTLVSGDADHNGYAYVPAEAFTTADFTSTQLDLAFDSSYDLPQGTWMALAILGDESTIKFTDKSTWKAWNADVIVLGSPLRTAPHNAVTAASGAPGGGEYTKCE